METLGLKNVNMLSKANYDTVVEPAKDELWAVEVETYSDDEGNWYRVYPDGWCEQGGELTSVAADTSTSVNLLKPYANTNYSVLITATGGKRSTTQFTNGQTVYSRTTTGFVMWTNDYDFGRIWRACGYIA